MNIRNMLVTSDGLGPCYPAVLINIDFGTKFNRVLPSLPYFNTLHTMSGFDRVNLSARTLDMLISL